MLNQVSQCISPYDFTTGLPLTSVNLSVAMVSDDLILDDAQGAASVQLPLNEKIFDEPPTFTVTSLRRTFMEDLLNLSRGAILSDALRVDVSKNIGALGLCESSANPEKTHLLTEENLVVFQFPYPSSSPIFEIINTPVSCNGGNPSVTSIACFGKNVSISCDGNEDSTLTFVCKREMQPICDTTIFSNANIIKPSDNICFLQSFNSHSI